MDDTAELLDLPSFRPEMAFPFLTEAMIDCIQKYGVEVNFPSETSLFSSDQHDADMFVILHGTIEIYTTDGQEEVKSIADLTRLQFTGELNLLNDQRTLVSARTSTESVLLRIPRFDLRRLLRAEGEIANLILQAFIWRRIGLAREVGAGVVLLGEKGDVETFKLQRFLARNGYPYHLVQEPAPERGQSSAGMGAESRVRPAVVLNNGRVLQRPTVAELADELGITQLPEPGTVYDVAVVGAGPAGLAAAVYAASEGLTTVAIEGVAPGGQAGTSSKIENYLGFPTGISGQRLAHRAWVQSLKFGVRFAISREAVALRKESGWHMITLEGGVSVCAQSVVVATGAQYRKLPVPNIEHFENRGVYYAATAMETPFCRNSEVIVVGGGNSAGQAALFLSQSASHVYLMIRGKSLAETMSEYLLARIELSARISILTETEIEGLDGESHLEQVTWVDRRNGSRTSKPITSLFAMIGAQPNTAWLNGVVKLDSKGFVRTGVSNALESTAYATSVPGIYAVGDVRTASVKRVASAVGEGSVVISDVHRYLAGQVDRLAAKSAGQV